MFDNERKKMRAVTFEIHINLNPMCFLSKKYKRNAVKRIKTNM